MLQKKMCMLGAFAVGKTSLVSRFVHSVFSDRYLTTVGVKIDKEIVSVAGVDVMMILWDIHGEDDLQEVRPSYLRGMHGYLLVSDITRPATLQTALELHERARGVVGDVPCAFLINKCDLVGPQETELLIAGLNLPMRCFGTSAHNGTHVESAFEFLAEQVSGGSTS
ncbi:MAG: GTP-binding protein [Planctomycetota bacterium]|nr:GTP-binding protein [Planctomycetota bacterium]MDA1180353.1 GTP-binding protein [Planctomycetota bacterium]